MPPGETDLTSVAELVSRAARRAPQRVALISGAQRLRWADLDEAVTATAGGLLGLGLAPGDRLGVLLGNTLDFPRVYFGALRAGLVVVPINIGYTERELVGILTDAGAVALIGTPDNPAVTPQLRDAVPSLRHVILAGSAAPPAGALALAELTGTAPAAGFPSRGGEDLAVLMYTSGTSGAPKGAMLSHRALLANLDQVSRIEPAPVSAEDVVLLVLPLFHIYGLNTGLGMVAWAGATGVLIERFDPVATLEAMAAERVSTLAGAPPMFLAWAANVDTDTLRRCCASVRLALSGAAPLPGTALVAMRDRAGVEVYEGYGLTETAPVLTSTLMSGTLLANSIGRPIPGVQVALWDADGDPIEEEDGTGQIVVRGANLFSGYWPDGADGPDEAGWFATGDIAFLDEQGDLHLVDRLKDLILVRGFNVYPREVELVLLAHPGIVDAAVIGVPDASTGEAVRAVVVTAPGHSPSAADLIAYCAGSLAKFKCPVAVDFVDRLPHSVTGKVSKARLRELGFPTAAGVG